MMETRATSDSDRLQSRLRPVRSGALTVDTHLDHFALVIYAVPPERLRALIPGERFDLELVSIDGRESALVSAVPFLDVGFHFRALPIPRFSFGQTNYRAYVRDKRSGEPAVWFFGTTLGSPIVAIPRALWRIPWHRARYHFQCEYDAAADRYARYEIDAESDWSPMHLALDDSGAAAGTQSRHWSAGVRNSACYCHPGASAIVLARNTRI